MTAGHSAGPALERRVGEVAQVVQHIQAGLMQDMQQIDHHMNNIVASRCMRMHKGFHQVLQTKNMPHAFELHADASTLKLAALAEGAAMLAGGRAPA